MRNYRRVAVLLSSLALGMLFLPLEGHGQEISLETIRKAWQARQDKVRTFRFVWDVRYTAPKGYYHDGRKNDENPDGAVIPPETTTYDTDFRLSMDGDKVRYEANDIILSVDLRLTHQKSYYVGTNEGSREFLPPGSGSYPRGTIGGVNPQRIFVASPHITPLLLTYRPLDARSNLIDDFPKEFQLLRGRSAIEGRSCLQIKEISTSPSQGITTLWVDPERDFVVTRLTRSNNDGPYVQTTLHQFQHSQHGWVPLRWTRVILGEGGSVRCSMSATVRSWQVNVDLDEKEFEVEFPLGTLVTDFSGSREQNYILLEGGKRRSILENELLSGATYEQFLHSESGSVRSNQAPGAGRGVWTGLALLGALTLIIVLVVAFRCRKLETLPPR